MKATEAALLDGTGIRTLRRAPVFGTPAPAPRPARTRRGRRTRRPRRSAAAAQVLRLQGRVPAPALLLRPALPALRRAQLRQAHPDRRPHGPHRCDRDRRPREDRLPGRHPAAARGRAGDRDDPLPPRRRPPLRPRAGLRRLARPHRGPRPRSPADPRRGALRPPRDRPRAPARFHPPQRLPDRAPPARLLRAPDRSRAGPDRGAARRGAPARPRLFTRGRAAPAGTPPRTTIPRCSPRPR